MKRLLVKFKYWDYLILLLLLAQCIYYGYQNILPLEPQSLHIWRQSDGASYAWNYATQTTNFFKPRMNNLALNQTGKVATEFPIIYYISGMSYRLIGIQAWFHRLINIGIVLFGLFSFYRAIDSFFHSKFWAILLPMFLFTTPLLVFYTNNFLPDVPAFALSLAAASFFFMYIQDSRRIKYGIAILLFTLSALLKLSYLLAFCVLPFLYLLERIPYKNSSVYLTFPPLFKEKDRFHLLSFFLVFILVFSWYTYASWYSTGTLIQHFTSILTPASSSNSPSISEILRFVFSKLQEDFYVPNVNHFFMLFLSLALLTGFGKAPQLLRLSFSMLLMGILAYLILFKDLIRGHDYYLSPVFLLVIPLYIYAAYLMESFAKDKKIRHYLQAFLVLLLLLNIQNAKMEMQYCYYDNKFHFKEKPPFYEEEFQEFLLTHGVQSESKVISYPDPSMNNTLYLMRRRGWTSLGIERMDANFVTQLKMEGAEFLILNDTTFRQDSLLAPALRKRIGTYEGIDIYDLSGLKW